MYTIKNYNRNINTIIFNKQSLGEYSVNLDNYKDYRAVSFRHFINKNNDIILVPEFFNRLFYIDTNNDVYYRANQFQFDMWNSVNYPDSDNAKIYTLLTSK